MSLRSGHGYFHARPGTGTMQAARGGRWFSREVCPPAGSGPPCSPRGSLPGQGRLVCLLDWLLTSVALSLRSGGGVSYLHFRLLYRPEASPGVGLGNADRSQPRARSGLPALATRWASGRFPGTGLPGCCHDSAPPRRAASCCDLSRTKRRPPGGDLLDGLEPEELGTRWVSHLPSGHTGMRAHWATTAASCYDAIAPGASWGHNEGPAPDSRPAPETASHVGIGTLRPAPASL